MGLNFTYFSIMLRLLFLSYMMTSFCSTEAYVYLEDHPLTVLKEEAFTSLNNTVPKTNDGSSDTSRKEKDGDSTKDTPEIRHISLLKCTNITLNKGEYEIYKNGTLHIKALKMALNSSSYVQNGDKVTLCKPTKKDIEYSNFVKGMLAFLTFAYTLITMLSAMCSFSKNSTYLKLALISWICVSSNIFIWIIVILIIPGPQSLFSWVSLSVNMNQSVYLTSAWMALITSKRALKFLQNYGFIEITKHVVTVKVGPLGLLCVIMAASFAGINFLFDRYFFVGEELFFDCLFCNPLTYACVSLLVLAESFAAPFEKNHTDVSRNYASYHISLCKFSIFNFYCICIGTIAVIGEWHIFLWTYTLVNFLWPLYVVKHIIPRLQTFMALASDDDEIDEKVADEKDTEKLISPIEEKNPEL